MEWPGGCCRPRRCRADPRRAVDPRSGRGARVARSRASPGGCGSTATSSSDFPVDELDYAGLHAWSVRDLDGFWSAARRAPGCDLPRPRRPRRSAAARCPAPQWFPGSTLNYAEHALTAGPGRERRRRRRDRGREDGDRTRGHPRRAARPRRPRPRRAWPRPASGGATGWSRWSPTRVETLVAFLATASLGAVWSSCSPDFGARAVLDRFAQIEPTVLVAVDGYRYNGSGSTCGRPSRRCRRRCPRCGPRCWCRTSTPDATLDGTMTWADAHRHRRAAGVHAGPVRPPAVGAVLLRDDRAAQGRSCSRTAGSSSSTSSRSRCSTTSAPATGSCGSPPPAG